MKTESKIQQEIFRYYWNAFCLPNQTQRECIFHVANENQHKLMNIGVLAGVSDLILTFRGKTYYCEVKTPTGRQKPSQIEFEKHIKQTGHEYFIVRSLDEFQAWLLGKTMHEAKDKIKLDIKEIIKSFSQKY